MVAAVATSRRLDIEATLATAVASLRFARGSAVALRICTTLASRLRLG